MRRLLKLLAPGGRALLWLNAPALGPDFLQQPMAERAPDLVFGQRRDNPAWRLPMSLRSGS